MRGFHASKIRLPGRARSGSHEGPAPGDGSRQGAGQVGPTQCQLALADAEALAEADADAEALADADAEALADALTDAEADALGVSVALGTGNESDGSGTADGAAPCGR